MMIIIYWKARFFGPSGISIGHNTIVEMMVSDGRGGLSIGNNVNIAGEVHFTMEHDINSDSFAITVASYQ